MSNPTLRSAKTPIAVAIATAASMTAMQAFSQEDTEEKSTLALEEITVTATKRAVALQDLPQSVAAFDARDIAKMGVRNLQDIAAAIPGLSTVSPNPGQNEIVFRGISTGTGEWRLDASSAVYLDETPLTAGASQVDIEAIDMERIEALPGPQGTLFGSSSQSGAMRYVTIKPDTSEFGGWAEIEGASVADGDTSYRVQGAVNIPVVEDKLAVRLVGYDVKQGGYVDNVAGTSLFGGLTNDDVVENDFNTWERTGFRASARWHITDDWTTDVMYMQQRSETNGDNRTDPTAGDLAIVRFFDDQRVDDWYSGSLTLSGDLGWGNLTVAASHLERTVDYEFDNMVDTQINAHLARQGYLASAYNVDYQIGTLVNDERRRRSSVEIRLQSQDDSNFRWMVGGYYEDSHTNWNYYYNVPNLSDTTAWGNWYYDPANWSGSLSYNAYWQAAYGYDVQYPVVPTEKWWDTYFYRDTKQRALFGEFEYDISDKLTVLFGLRWFEFDRQRSEYTYYPERVPYGNYANAGLDYYDAQDDDIVKKFSVRYNITDDVMVYGTYSEGFRLGGDNSQRQGSILPDRYEADKLTNYEFGLKSEWFDGRLQYNSVIYYMEWENMQRSVGDPGYRWDWKLNSVSATINVGDAKSTGWENTLKFNATENLSFDATWTVNEASMKEDATWADSGSDFSGVPDWAIVPNCDASADWWCWNPETDKLSSAGQDLAIGTPFKWYIGVDYTVPQIAWGADLNIRYDHQWEEARFHDWWNAREYQDNLDGDTQDGIGQKLIPDQQQGNFSMRLDSEDNWTLSLRVNNVWDDRSVTWVDTWKDGALGDLGLSDDRYRSLQSIKRPREVMLGFTKYF